MENQTTKKRMFQVLDEMNQMDIENNTQLVTLHNSILEMNHVKQGTKVTVGVPPGILNIAHQISDNPKKRIVLMIVDGEEFDKRMKM